MDKKQEDQEQNLPAQKQDFVLYCVDKMQSIPENLPEKIKTMMMETIGQRMEMYLDKEEADTLSKSDLLPKEYKGNSSNIMLAFKTGRSLGLDRLQSLQHTVTINGRTRVYGDMMLALAMKHDDYQDIIFEYGDDVETDDDHGKLPSFVKCIVKAKGRVDVESLYRVEDAQKNPNYKNKFTPWMNGHARRMMKFRAQSFALRDAFPDKLTGIYDEYEFEEIQTVNKNITAETTDLGKSGTDGLKDSLKEDEATEPTDVVIQDYKGEDIQSEDATEDKKEEQKAQEKPGNIEQIKVDFKKWLEEKIVSKEEYQKFADTGGSGEWDKIVEMHEKFSKKADAKPKVKPLGKFAKKLKKIVDLDDYADSINSLVTDTNIDLLTPENVGKVLRTKDEKLAQEVFNLIEDRKDMIDSAKKDTDQEGEAY